MLHNCQDLFYDIYIAVAYIAAPGPGPGKICLGPCKKFPRSTTRMHVQSRPSSYFSLREVI